MKLLKKWPLIVGILLISVIIIAVLSMLPIWWFSYASRWKHNADYDAYAQDFARVADWLQTTYPNAANVCLSVSSRENGNIGLYDVNARNSVECPAEIRDAIRRIDTAFSDPDAPWDCLRLDAERISFCIPNGQYELVYSPNQRPTWMYTNGKTERIYVQAIQNGWYHVAHNPG